MAERAPPETSGIKKRREPSSWVRRYSGEIRDGGTVLDLACGSGRHSRLFAELGCPVTAVDVAVDDVTSLATSLQSDSPSAAPIEVLRADLENDAWPFGGFEFDGIVVVNYLHRPLFAPLRVALSPGGVLIYDTFAVGNERYGKPRNPAYLLEPGELLREFGARLEVVTYQHGEVSDPQQAVRQSIVVRR